MDEYREFIVTFRELELEGVYFLLHENMTPTLGKYVKLVRDVKYEDGTYKMYYGEMKKIITSFTAYYNEKIDKTIREVDKYMQICTKEIIMDLCVITIDNYEKKQQNFEFEFLPVRSPEERDSYNRIKNKMSVFVEKLNEMSNKVSRLDKQFKVDAFARQVLPAAISGDAEKFKFTHQFLSRMLATRVTKIYTSISEINIKVCHVLKKKRAHCEDAINSLLHELYDVNKESLRLHRENRTCSIDNAEVEKSIQLIRQKLDEFHPDDKPLRRLEEEVNYWTRKSQEIDHIGTALAKLKHEKEDLKERAHRLVLRQEHRSCYSDKFEDDDDEILSPKILQHRIMEAEKQYDEVARCLFTFLSLRGSNINYYRDHIGQFYIDEYGHKIYSFDFGLELCYLHKNGTLVDISEIENKYFDEYGKYIYEESNDDSPMNAISIASNSRETLFFASSDDVLTIQRNIEVKDKAKVDKKQELMDIDLKNKLDGETVTYLWNALGSILPDALFDTYSAQPKNPITCLAHNLLKHKYARSTTETKEKKEEADKYREKIIRERHEKAMDEARNWKSKQSKHVKKDICNIEHQIIDAFQVAQHDFILGNHFSDAI